MKPAFLAAGFLGVVAAAVGPVSVLRHPMSSSRSMPLQADQLEELHVEVMYMCVPLSDMLTGDWGGDFLAATCRGIPVSRLHGGGTPRCRDTSVPVATSSLLSPLQSPSRIPR